MARPVKRRHNRKRLVQLSLLGALSCLGTWLLGGELWREVGLAQTSVSQLASDSLQEAQILGLTGEVALVSLLMVALHRLKVWLGLLPLYLYLGIICLLLFPPGLAVQLTDTWAVYRSSALYLAALLNGIVLLYTLEGTAEARKAIASLLLACGAIYILQALSALQAINPLTFSPDFADKIWFKVPDPLQFLAAGLSLTVDSLVLVGLYQFLVNRLKTVPLPLSLFGAYLVTVALDSIVFWLLYGHFDSPSLIDFFYTDTVAKLGGSIVSGIVVMTYIGWLFRQNRDELRNGVLNRPALMIVLPRRQFEQMQAALAAQRRQEEFVATLTHDLRTPLMGMLMVLKSLTHTRALGATELAPLKGAVLEGMIHAGERQLNLINTLLEVHQNDTRGPSIHPKIQPLQPSLEGAVATVQTLLIEQQSQLELVIPTDLPPLEFDANQVQRVLENLLGNALRHNPEPINIVLSVEQRGQSYWIRVQDNGVGLTAEECEQLFERHSRGTHNWRSASSGLGLYLCRQIVEAHGGRIWAESLATGGAAFNFTLPNRPVSQELA
ncbi:HAMP domain-containing sensor histidine kinase [Leptolyngbya sp. FACHB-261]|uniref:sensor histidine kinase n=1 Tax=Leptolyngbya sp. FACHB-261 TaxID=2692806 RepID=UPI0016824A35|nr:HAMP domain-containing sensor histidine kinase [Leptolyngbya sp. FACHB-261]MBD2101852.1 HAMP domain-containing histidine kinase [Leptolyngbya sp. FACHB-261]